MQGKRWISHLPQPFLIQFYFSFQLVQIVGNGKLNALHPGPVLAAELFHIFIAKQMADIDQSISSFPDSISPYFFLMRSSFSRSGLLKNHKKITVDSACTRSTGIPEI